MLPYSSESFIDFCLSDDIWIHLRHNIVSINYILSSLCQDLEDLNSSDALKELHITNLCRVSSAERLLYVLTIKLIKEIDLNLLQLHLQNVQKIYASYPRSLENYFKFIKSVYKLISPIPLSDRANWIKVLQEINTLPLDLD